VQAARLAEDFLGSVLGARATQEQAIVLSPPYVDAARQLLAEEIVKREDSKHAAVYLSAVFYAVREEADTPLSSEDIEAAKHQWVQVCFIEPDILIFWCCSPNPCSSWPYSVCHIMYNSNPGCR